MTLERFKSIINTLNIYYDREKELSNALEPFNSSYTIIEFCPEITKFLFDMVKEEFNDTNDWFSWWFFETEQGKVDYGITDCDDNIILLNSIDSIYQFLKENDKNQLQQTG